MSICIMCLAARCCATQTQFDMTVSTSPPATHRAFRQRPDGQVLCRRRLRKADDGCQFRDAKLCEKENFSTPVSPNHAMLMMQSRQAGFAWQIKPKSYRAAPRTLPLLLA